MKAITNKLVSFNDSEYDYERDFELACGDSTGVARLRSPRQLSLNLGYANNPTVEVFSGISDSDIDSIMDFANKGFSTYDVDGFTYIGSGSYSKVYRFKNYAIKNINSITDISKNNDRQALLDLQGIKYIPKLHAVINHRCIVMEFIEGDTMEDILYSKTNIGNFNIAGMMNDFKDALYEIILNGYSPHDMHQGNVMFDYNSGTIRLIDLGWFFKHNQSYNSKEDASKDYHYGTALKWAGRYIEDIMAKEGVCL